MNKYKQKNQILYVFQSEILIKINEVSGIHNGKNKLFFVSESNK